MGSRLARHLWVAWCAAMAILYVLSLSENELSDLVLLVFGASVAAVIAVCTYALRPFSKTSWALIAAGTALLVLSRYLFDGESRSLDASLRATENMAYACALILLLIANFVLVGRQHRSIVDRAGILDTLIVFVAAAMIACEYLIFPLLWPGHGNTELLTQRLDLGNMTLVVFEVLSVILLSSIARAWFATDISANRGVRVLLVGEVALVIGSGIGVTSGLDGGFGTTTLAQILVAVCALVFFALAGIAAMDPTGRRAPAGDLEAGVTLRSRILMVVGICMLVPSILLLATPPIGDFSRSNTFVAGTLILTMLLILRMDLLLRGYRDAVRREHLLREINAGLMRGASVQEIHGRLDDWAGRLVAQPAVTCQLGTFAELEAAGINAHRTRLRAPDGRVRYRTVVGVPGTRPQRRLVVETPDVINGPALASLAVLGQSVGMAMERIALAHKSMERQANERLERLLHNASDVIALVSETGRIDYVTEAIRDITNEEPDSIIGVQWIRLFEDPERASELLDMARESEESRGDLVIDPISVAKESEAESAPWTDRELTAELVSAPEKRLEVDVAWLAAERQYVVTHHDVTDRYELEQQLVFQAYHDELTGLSNRAVFRAELARAAARTRRAGATFAVMMIDLDDFKNVNDSFGHPAGDELLREVAKRLVSVMREGDTPVRLGGDEFAVILESARSAEDAEAVATRLLAALDEPVHLRGTEIVIGASIGIAVSDGNVDPADVERDADIALYDAKFAGKNRVALFRSDMHETAVEKMSLTSQLRGALERGEIVLRYQPIYELDTGRISGVEALMRWMHPTRGELVPDMFIALAEETGVIVDIGRYAIRKAIGELAEVTDAHPKFSDLRLSINISGKQLTGEGVAKDLRKAIKKHKVAPRRIIVEVTESVLLPDDGAAAQELRAIGDLGVSIYIDDFGTGWASLHYLRSLPVTGLKLAQEFVRGLPGEFDGGLARAIRELSRTLMFEEVVAEGVETTVQREALIDLGYRLGQGYLMGRPMRPAKLSEALAAGEPGNWDAVASASDQAVS